MTRRSGTLLLVIAAISLSTTPPLLGQRGQSGAGTREAADAGLHELLRKRSSLSDETSIYEVSDARLRSTRAWTPEKEPPPLSVTAAVKLAQKHLKPARPSDMILMGVEIRPTYLDDAVRWHYTISVYDREQTMRNEPPEIVDVVVLMDGTFVEPKKGK